MPVHLDSSYPNSLHSAVEHAATAATAAAVTEENAHKARERKRELTAAAWNMPPTLLGVCIRAPYQRESERERETVETSIRR